MAALSLAILVTLPLPAFAIADIERCGVLALGSVLVTIGLAIAGARQGATR